MYFWITEVVPYLRNDIWLLSVKTNSILYELERFISINSVNPLSGNRRDVMSFLQCLCKAALEPLEEGWLFGGHQCSAVHFDVLWFLSLCSRIPVRQRCVASGMGHPVLGDYCANFIVTLVICHQSKTSVQKASKFRDKQRGKPVWESVRATESQASCADFHLRFLLPEFHPCQRTCGGCQSTPPLTETSVY